MEIAALEIIRNINITAKIGNWLLFICAELFGIFLVQLIYLNSSYMNINTNSQAIIFTIQNTIFKIF
jgi:hypothetical protein